MDCIDIKLTDWKVYCCGEAACQNICWSVFQWCEHGAAACGDTGAGRGQGNLQSPGHIQWHAEKTGAMQYDDWVGQDINLVIMVWNIDFENANSEYCPWKNADTLYFVSIYL